MAVAVRGPRPQRRLHARKYVAARTTASVIQFLAAQERLNKRWLRSHIRTRGLMPDVHNQLRIEDHRERVWQQRSAGRVARDLPRALERPIRSASYKADRRARQRAVQDVLAREMKFAQWHARELARRTLAAVNRGRVRQASPEGAFWMLGHAKQHTEGCLVMAGRFWPWVVLERVHPPRHAGCTSHLLSRADAVKAGYMKDGEVVMSRAEGLAAARDVMMEGEADRLLAELAVRDRLVELGADASALEEIPWQGVLTRADLREH